MLTYLEFLMGWASGRAASNRTTPVISAQLGDETFEKRSAWIQIEGASVAGQLTVWVTGECELEAYRIESSEVVILEHRHISSVEELEGAVRTILAACEDDPR